MKHVVQRGDNQTDLAVGILPPLNDLGVPKDCQCEKKLLEATLCIRNFEWERVANKTATLTVYNVGVTFDDDIPRIDASGHYAIVVPDDVARIHSPHVVHMGELCSGGFAGWVHAQSVCCCFNVNIKSIFAVEIDHQICDIYCKTWERAVKIDSLENFFRRLPSNKYPIFATDIEQGWWILCMANKAIDILAFSPPCQPWSDAGLCRGLNSHDGWVMISGLVVASMLRVRTIAIEQVASIRRHIHWKFLLQVIEKCGFKIIEERVVNMSTISPQNRERLLLVMVRNDESFQTCDRKCEFPSIGLQSLVAFQAFQNDLGSFEEYVKISQTVLEKYLDHRYLPTMKSDKKRKVDVMTYRIRQPNDSVGCIMASYGSQHEFSEENLLTKGLFGSLLQDGDRVRFFSGAEVLILMMPCQTVFLPKDRKLHMKIVGNGITSAHAIFALSFAIRALGFCDSPCADPTQMVLETLKRRMHFGNVSIQEFADGWRICKQNEAVIDIPMNIDISDTIRDDRFQKVKIFSGQWNLSGFTEPFIDARDVIRSLGMKDDFITRVYQTSDALIIQVKQPMVLPLLQIKWGNVNSDFVMVLIQGKFVLLSKICENSVDEALKEHHQIDPLNQHLKGLPQKFRGRCIHRQREKVYMQNPTSYANDGSYNPTALAFTVMAKHKVKQVRRIQSLYRSMQNHFTCTSQIPEYELYLQWKGEWNKIQHAKGYGDSWCHWILGFDHIVEVPWNVPSVQFLSTVLQITQHDCEHTCVQEQNLRCQAYKQTLQFDRTDNYLRNTYKIIKEKPNPPVTSVESSITAEVTLVRSKKNRIQFKILGKLVEFSKDRELRLGDSILELVCQKNDIVTVVHKAGYVPTKGFLKQKWFAMTPGEVDKAFHDFWSPFWNRDSLETLTSDNEWQDILEILDSFDDTDDIMDIKLDDPGSSCQN